VDNPNPNNGATSWRRSGPDASLTDPSARQSGIPPHIGPLARLQRSNEGSSRQAADDQVQGPLVLTTGESRALRRAWALAAATGGCLTAMASDSEPVWRLIWILISIGAALLAYRRQTAPDGRLQLESSGRVCWRSSLKMELTGQVDEGAWITPWMTVLSARCDAGKRYRFVVQGSRQATEDYRRLIVWLRNPPKSAYR
jgi:hypothetical protein